MKLSSLVPHYFNGTPSCLCKHVTRIFNPPNVCSLFSTILRDSFDDSTSPTFAQHVACYFRATRRRTTSDISLSPGSAENNRDEAGGQLKERGRLFALVDRIRFLSLFPSFFFFPFPFFSPRFVSRRRDIELLRAAIPDALRPQRLKGAGYEAPYTT